ncbi:MAG: histidine kinase [Polyangiaceae bacterium]
MDVTEKGEDRVPESQVGPEASEDTNVLQSTMAAIFAPRRAIPIVLVIVPLLFIQHVYSREAGALLLGALMCATFVVVGPTLWRHLFPMGDDTRRPYPVASIAVYGAVGIALVVGIGRGLADLVGMGTTFLTSRPSLLVEVALFWVGGWGLARDIDFEENLRKERARARELLREKEHAELVALKSHLDPHFLFNTLNAIAEWCRADGRVAEKAIVRLSGMLRTVMTGIDAPGGVWPLEKELDLCDALFEMYLVRDPEMFEVERRIDGRALSVTLPPLVLLPIAENAMKHGPSKGHRGKVVIAVSVGPTHVSVRVENPGPYAGPRDGGHGLDIVRRRLALAYGDRATFVIEGEGDRTVCTVEVPAALKGKSLK